MQIRSSPTRSATGTPAPRGSPTFDGMERAWQTGLNQDRIGSVASFIVSIATRGRL
jgi:hypothetical protein